MEDDLITVQLTVNGQTTVKTSWPLTALTGVVQLSTGTFGASGKLRTATVQARQTAMPAFT